MNYLRENSKQAAKESFTGLWAAMTTPFTADGEIDDQALINDLNVLADEIKIDGVFCTGVMGEFWALSQRERKHSVEVIVENTRGRFPVLAHTGHHSARETIELTRHAAKVGADFVVVINPYYPAASDAGLKSWYLEVLDSVEIGVWLFDTNYSGISLSNELLDQLADIENVCGIKVGHNHARYLEILKLVGDRILVCEPNETQWLANMRDHGQQVFMSSAAPYLLQSADRQPMLEYTKLALAGDFEKATMIYNELQPVRDLTEKWIHGRWAHERINPVPAIKAWSGLLGMSGGTVRAPLTDLNPAQRSELETDLRKVGLISM
jgi:4-hydroxy-tetrahydrodipicolinate synthase